MLIATRNRADHLAASLRTILYAAASASFTTEVVVVNNGSTDRTLEVLGEFPSNAPNLRIITDPRPGKSGAVNRGLRECSGEVIVFTDDDVHVSPSWVDDMASPILSGTADAVCGRVVLAPFLDRPWLTPGLRTALAEITDVSGELPGMVGASMAARRDVAIAVGFDEELGPGARGFADDVMFNLRLKGAHYRLVGCVGPPAEHNLSEDRLSYLQMKSLAERNGSSHAYLWHHLLGSNLGLLRVRRLRAQAQLMLERVRHRPDPAAISEREYDLLYDISFLSALRKEKLRPRKYA